MVEKVPNLGQSLPEAFVAIVMLDCFWIGLVLLANYYIAGQPVAEFLFEGSICGVRPLSRKSLTVNLNRLKNIPVLHTPNDVTHVSPEPSSPNSSLKF